MKLQKVNESRKETYGPLDENAKYFNIDGIVQQFYLFILLRDLIQNSIL